MLELKVSVSKPFLVLPENWLRDGLSTPLMGNGVDRKVVPLLGQSHESCLILEMEEIFGVNKLVWS